MRIPEPQTLISIVSDDTLWSASVRMLFDSESTITVEFFNQKKTSIIIRELRLKQSSLVILDLRNRSKQAKDFVGLVSRECPHTRIIAILGDTDPAHTVELFTAGADAVLGLDTSPEDLRLAARKVNKGLRYVSSTILQDLVSALALCSHSSVLATSLLTSLPPREFEVIQCLKLGQSNSEIAVSLCCAESTVKLHLSSVMRKWGARDRVQLVIKVLDGCPNTSDWKDSPETS